MPESLLTKALAHLRANAVDGVFSASMASIAEAIGCVEQVASDMLGHLRDHGNLEYVARGYIGRAGKFRILDGVDTEWMARTIVWDDVMIGQISTLWVQGLTASEIGVRLGITKNAVLGKARRLGLPARGSPIIRTLGEAVTNKPERHKRAVNAQRSTPAEPPIRPAITARHDQRHAFPVITARPTVRQPAIVRVRPPERPSLKIMSGKCQWPLWSDNARPSHKYCDAPAPWGFLVR